MHTHTVDIATACQAVPLNVGVETYSNSGAQPDAVDDEYAFAMPPDCMVSNVSGPGYTTDINTPSVFFDFQTYDYDLVEYRISFTSNADSNCSFTFGGDGGGVSVSLMESCSLDSEPLVCARSDPLLIEPPDDPAYPVVDLVVPAGTLEPNRVYRIRVRVIDANDHGCFSTCISAQLDPEQLSYAQCDSALLLTRTSTFSVIPDIYTETRHPTEAPSRAPSESPTLAPTPSPSPLVTCNETAPDRLSGECGASTACSECLCTCSDASGAIVGPCIPHTGSGEKKKRDMLPGQQHQQTLGELVPGGTCTAPMITYCISGNCAYQEGQSVTATTVAHDMTIPCSIYNPAGPMAIFAVRGTGGILGFSAFCTDAACAIIVVRQQTTPMFDFDSQSTDANDCSSDYAISTCAISREEASPVFSVAGWCSNTIIETTPTIWGAWYSVIIWSYHVADCPSATTDFLFDVFTFGAEPPRYACNNGDNRLREIGSSDLGVAFAETTESASKHYERGSYSPRRMTSCGLFIGAGELWYEMTVPAEEVYKFEVTALTSHGSDTQYVIVVWDDNGECNSMATTCDVFDAADISGGTMAVYLSPGSTQKTYALMVSNTELEGPTAQAATVLVTNVTADVFGSCISPQVLYDNENMEAVVSSSFSLILPGGPVCGYTPPVSGSQHTLAIRGNGFPMRFEISSSVAHARAHMLEDVANAVNLDSNVPDTPICLNGSSTTLANPPLQCWTPGAGLDSKGPGCDMSVRIQTAGNTVWGQWYYLVTTTEYTAHCTTSAGNIDYAVTWLSGGVNVPMRPCVDVNTPATRIQTLPDVGAAVAQSSSPSRHYAYGTFSPRACSPTVPHGAAELWFHFSHTPFTFRRFYIVNVTTTGPAMDIVLTVWKHTPCSGVPIECQSLTAGQVAAGEAEYVMSGSSTEYYFMVSDAGAAHGSVQGAVVATEEFTPAPTVSPTMAPTPSPAEYDVCLTHYPTAVAASCTCIDDIPAFTVEVEIDNPTLLPCDGSTLYNSPLLAELQQVLAEALNLTEEQVIISNAECGSWRFRLTIVSADAKQHLEEFVRAFIIEDHLQESDAIKAVRDNTQLMRHSVGNTLISGPGLYWAQNLTAAGARCPQYTQPLPADFTDSDGDSVPDVCEIAPTQAPTQAPTAAPQAQPTKAPTESPTHSPFAVPQACNAMPLTCGAMHVHDTFGYPDSDVGGCAVGLTHPVQGSTRWFYFTSEAYYEYTLSTCNDGFGGDSMIHVYESTGAAFCTDPLTCVADNDDAANCTVNQFLSTVTLTTTEETKTYFVAVNEYDTFLDLIFGLNLTCVPPDTDSDGTPDPTDPCPYIPNEASGAACAPCACAEQCGEVLSNEATDVYSLHRVVDGYTGAALELTDKNDGLLGATVDIYFEGTAIGESLNRTELLDAVNSGYYYVNQWYNQVSGRPVLSTGNPGTRHPWIHPSVPKLGGQPGIFWLEDAGTYSYLVQSQFVDQYSQGGFTLFLTWHKAATAAAPQYMLYEFGGGDPHLRVELHDTDYTAFEMGAATPMQTAAGQPLQSVHTVSYSDGATGAFQRYNGEFVMAPHPTVLDWASPTPSQRYSMGDGYSVLDHMSNVYMADYIIMDKSIDGETLLDAEDYLMLVYQTLGNDTTKSRDDEAVLSMKHRSAGFTHNATCPPRPCPYAPQATNVRACTVCPCTETECLTSVGLDATTVFALRRVVQGYSGAAVRVQHPTNALLYQDIGFEGADVGASLNIADSLQAQSIGATRIVVWYNQVNQSQNLVQSDASLAPTLDYVSPLNFKPAVFFDSRVDYLQQESDEARHWTAGRTVLGMAALLPTTVHQTGNDKYLMHSEAGHDGSAMRTEVTDDKLYSTFGAEGGIEESNNALPYGQSMLLTMASVRTLRSGFLRVNGALDSELQLGPQSYSGVAADAGRYVIGSKNNFDDDFDLEDSYIAEIIIIVADEEVTRESMYEMESVMATHFGVSQPQTHDDDGDLSGFTLRARTVAPPACITESPTSAPTESPTLAPSKAPTESPTKAPTESPTLAPSKAPSESPTPQPTHNATTANGVLAEFTFEDPTPLACSEAEVIEIANELMGNISTLHAIPLSLLVLINATCGSYVVELAFLDGLIEGQGNVSAQAVINAFNNASSPLAQWAESQNLTLSQITLPQHTYIAPPTAAPTESPSLAPTESPTKAPSKAPTEQPSRAPTESPTKAPTGAPTEQPSAAPTESPSKAPTKAPTEQPSRAPTESPSKAPSKAPTESPTNFPTPQPTPPIPTESPTAAPSKAPSEAPSAAPSQAPTEEPTKAPSEAPTKAPSKAPTEEPTKAPTEQPSRAPTESPTQTPTQSPTITCPLIGLCTASSGDVFSVCAPVGTCPQGSQPDANTSEGESCVGSADPTQSVCQCCERNCDADWQTSPCAQDSNGGKTCVPKGTCTSRFGGDLRSDLSCSASVSAAAADCECCDLFYGPPAPPASPSQQTITACSPANNVATGNEACDGSDLRGESCASLGFASGTLACDASCAFYDTSGCEPYGVCCTGPTVGQCTSSSTAATCTTPGAQFIVNAPTCTDNLCYAQFNKGGESHATGALQPGGVKMELGTITHTSHNRLRSSPGVCSGCTIGTVGAMLRSISNGTTYALSNAHVWARVVGWSSSDNCAANRPPAAGVQVYQTGTCSGGNSIGTITAFAHQAPNAENTVDAATAIVTPSPTSMGYTQMGLGDQAPGAPVTPELGMIVIKASRTTGFTIGQITGIDVVQIVCGPMRDGSDSSYCGYYVDQIYVKGISPSSTFVLGGDSGSVVFEYGTMKAVGLLFAGSGDGTQATLNPMSAVFDAFFPGNDGEMDGPPARRKKKRNGNMAHGAATMSETEYKPHPIHQAAFPGAAGLQRARDAVLNVASANSAVQQLRANHTAFVSQFVGFSQDNPSKECIVFGVSSEEAKQRAVQQLPADMDGVPVEVVVAEPFYEA